MKQFITRISLNVPVAKDYYSMETAWPESAASPAPGQFLTIRVSSSAVPLLRRPFAFSAYDPDTRIASLIYQKKGPGTSILAGMKEGDSLDILGPNGNVFPLPEDGAKPVILGGGIGTGPVLFLAETLRAKGMDALLVLGYRGKEFVPYVPEINHEQTFICTDTGDLGYKGTPADWLHEHQKGDLSNTVIYACGPMPLLKFAHQIGQEHGVKVWVSMEQTMACGVGACMGCVIPANNEKKYARVCSDGPVFDSRMVVWK